MFKAYPERDPLLDIDVIVVGAGPGGLVAAIELWRIGCNVRVLEARPQDESAHGGPFGLGIPVLRHLSTIPGLKETLMTACFKVHSSWYTSSGRLIGGPYYSGSVDDLGPVLLTLTDRERFVKYLVEFLGHLNIPIQYGSRVVDYKEDKSLKKSFAITATGEALEADLIVAADGVGTKSWKLIAKERQLPKQSGFSIFRGSISTSSYLQSPILREEFGKMNEGYGHVHFYLGQDSHAVVVVTPDKIAFDLTRKPLPDTTVNESWYHTIPNTQAIQEIQRTGQDWHPAVLELFERCDENSIVDWPLLWRNPFSTWRSPHGHVIQLGDAAHSFLPTSANGATQALEDAISLAACVKLALKENLDIATATKVHNTLRFERTSCAQKAGWKNRKMLHNDAAKTAAENPMKLAQFVGKWLHNHDAQAYVHEMWELCKVALETQQIFKNTNLPPGYTYQPWTIDEMLAGCKFEKAGEIVEKEAGKASGMFEIFWPGCKITEILRGWVGFGEGCCAGRMPCLRKDIH